eukprot:CAMPEP_0119264730 /NCGR_PEP_ID=MMETSP1329-20130426/3741_1 /TAXON_ID=114041 /ORGANISM="Genus nov. species nov., Strain RCC1024" /LENGTH=220 /DNA_ID=CAMNT_0007264521 /DNA_START=75 /DNA_END=734 /DNA_ORIENTATION=+
MSTRNPLVAGQNVAFVAIARLSDRRVVAFRSNHADVDMEGVRAVLDPAQMADVAAHKHYNFASNGLAWHLESDGAMWIYLAITGTGYPLRHAAGLLAELRQTFAPKADKGLNVAAEGGLNREMDSRLARLCEQYDDLSRVDQLHSTLAKVESVKVVMQDSIELALQNCVSLESIDQKADELQSQAGMFRTKAKKLRSQMWWKKCKLQMLIAFLVIAVLAA